MANSLREQIAKLSSTLPEFKDPEDFFEDDTSARLVQKGEEEELDNQPIPTSRLRQRAAHLITESDEKYAGKRTSRNKLNDLEQLGNLPEEFNDEEEDSENEDEDDSSLKGDSFDYHEGSSSNVDDSEDDVNLEEFQSSFKAATQNESKPEFSFEDDGDYSKYADDDGDENVDDSDDMGSDDDDDDDDQDDINSDEYDDDKDEGEENEAEIKKFSMTSGTEEVQKGEATKQQLGLWDSFLEGRIKLQKVAGIINKMPQFDIWKQFEKEENEEFKQSAADTQAMLKKLLDKLVQLQTLLLLQNIETRHIVTGKKAEKEQQKFVDDEEIPSDTDEEEKPEQKQEPVHVGVKRKIKMEAYPAFLAKRHKDFQNFRNNTIQKWYDKTRLSGGKLKSKSFSNFEQSALKQIEQILGDKERLIKRTQLKRSVYSIIGKPDEEQNTDQQDHDGTEALGENLKNYDAEIFDDSDFYHQQLRELIERKTADIVDPVAISRQWLEIQKLRNKVKKKIDTKASKGRKVRYNTHSKLVNFMAQMDNCTWTDDSKDDLYKSLFGKRYSSVKTSTTNGIGSTTAKASDEC